MSHFSVLVIHEEGADLDAIMGPWMENCCDCPSEEYLEFFEDEACDVDPETGRRGYWQNPNAKWDWFEVGGRFSDQIPTKSGRYVTSARIGDIMTGPDQSRARELTKFWHEVVEAEPKEGERPPFCWPPVDVLKRHYASAEEYADANSRFSTYAVVKDGRWFSVGEMGWFGLGSEEDDAEREWNLSFGERFIEHEDPSMIATVLDCHI